MEKIKLLIADSDERFTEAVQRCCKHFENIELIAIDRDGHDALNRIRSTPIDAVLFDLLLPGIDGISLLRSINSLPDSPATICCTRFYSDVMLEAVRTYGASYLLFKPFDISILEQIIISCVEMRRSLQTLNKSVLLRNEDGTVYSAWIRNYLISLGIPSKLIGCSYLVEAVQLARADMSLMHNLSKGLYLEISRRMESTPERIERCIRNAVGTAYQRGELRMHMPSCPSNKEFINYILRSLPD